MRGVINVKIQQCREIAVLLAKYGLSGPAIRSIPGVGDEGSGADRWYDVSVVDGTEAATVVRLYAHPEDIEYVQLIPEFRGGVSVPTASP